MIGVVLVALTTLGFLLGFMCGLWFVFAGGVYVNKCGAIDVRWPPKRVNAR